MSNCKLAPAWIDSIPYPKVKEAFTAALNSYYPRVPCTFREFLMEHCNWSDIMRVLSVEANIISGCYEQSDLTPLYRVLFSNGSLPFYWVHVPPSAEREAGEWRQSQTTFSSPSVNPPYYIHVDPTDQSMHGYIAHINSAPVKREPTGTLIVDWEDFKKVACTSESASTLSEKGVNRWYRFPLASEEELFEFVTKQEDAYGHFSAEVYRKSNGKTQYKEVAGRSSFQLYRECTLEEINAVLKDCGMRITSLGQKHPEVLTSPNPVNQWYRYKFHVGFSESEDRFEYVTKWEENSGLYSASIIANGTFKELGEGSHSPKTKLVPVTLEEVNTVLAYKDLMLESLGQRVPQPVPPKVQRISEDPIPSRGPEPEEQVSHPFENKWVVDQVFSLTHYLRVEFCTKVVRLAGSLRLYYRMGTASDHWFATSSTSSPVENYRLATAQDLKAVLELEGAPRDVLLKAIQELSGDTLYETDVRMETKPVTMESPSKDLDTYIQRPQKRHKLSL